MNQIAALTDARPDSRAVVHAPAQAEEASLLAVIAKAARDPEVNVDKMQALMTMYERVEAKEASRAFDTAMSDAQAEMGRVVVDRENTQTHSKYATYAALDRAIRPIYSKHGFALSFNSGDSAPEFILVTCRVSHRAGFARDYQIQMPADGKGAKGGDVMTKTHATGSGASYGMRYLLKMIFNVATSDKADDDGNAAGGDELLTFEQVAQIEAAIVEKIGEHRRAKLLHYFKSESFEDLSAKKFTEIMATIDAAAKAASAKQR
jgi:hypothetical protein